MTTIDFNEFPFALPERKKFSLRGSLAGWWAALKRRRQERLTMLELSRLDSYLLRDMGINPPDVRDALSGGNSSILFDPILRSNRE